MCLIRMLMFWEEDTKNFDTRYTWLSGYIGLWCSYRQCKFESGLQHLHATLHPTYVSDHFLSPIHKNIQLSSYRFSTTGVILVIYYPYTVLPILQ